MLDTLEERGKKSLVEISLKKYLKYIIYRLIKIMWSFSKIYLISNKI
jgi:hypothetical protein